MQAGTRFDGRSDSRARVVVLVLVVSLAVATTACGGSQSGVSRSTTSAGGLARVDVFGDSLVVQAGDALRGEGLLHGLDVRVAAYSGAAPCDVAALVRSALDATPAALVLAFSGNNIGPCMARDGKPLLGAAYFAKYRKDVGAMVAAATAKSVPVFVVGPPSFPAAQDVPDRAALAAVLRAAVAARTGAHFVDLTPALSPDGFAWKRPCVAGETAALGCHDGMITVRSGNGIHFDAPRSVPCPSGGGSCSYTAGGHRCSAAILTALAPVIASAYRPAPATAGVPVVVADAG